MQRVVIALGGNALLRRGAPDTYEEMYLAARGAAERIADIAADGWEVVVTHGNGPQVGRILMQQEAAAKQVHPMPLDVCGAESQGQIGYLLQVTIGDVFFERGMERPVATILTLTRVRAEDAAFRNPTKYVGPLLHRSAGASACGTARVVDEAGPARRVAARRPEPETVVDRRDTRDPPLVADGVIVIAGGGGGVPVVETRAASDREGGRRRQGPRGIDPCSRGRGRRVADPHRVSRRCSAGSARSCPRRSTGWTSRRRNGC